MAISFKLVHKPLLNKNVVATLLYYVAPKLVKELIGGPRVRADFEKDRVEVDPTLLTLRRYTDYEEVKEAVKLEKEILESAVKVLGNRGIEIDVTEFAAGLILRFG